MRILKVLLVVLCLATPALAQSKSVEDVASDMVLLNCVTPIFTGDNAARFARQMGLIEFPKEAASKFLKDKSGAVFATEDALGKIVLMTLDNGVCQVSIREADAQKLWDNLDTIFDPNISPWKLVNEDRKSAASSKSYETDKNGSVSAFITVSDIPKEGSPQAIITMARHK